MDEHDIEITIISNNKLERVKVFSEPLGKPYVYSARKPLRRSFQEVTKQMGLKKDEIVVIVDQVLTDVLGGNRAGLYTILVVPIVQTDEKITRIKRMIERRILNYMRKKGKISWEELKWKQNYIVKGVACCFKQKIRVRSGIHLKQRSPEKKYCANGVSA